MKKVDHNDFKVTEPIDLDNFSPDFDLEAKKKKIKKELVRTRKKLGKWQDILYAHGKYSVLICLQGIDTSGKDSLIREVFKDFNSRGVVVHSFKEPTKLQLKHDFLWRHYIALPARGKFGVFNRTHYENVLVTRVHPDYLLKENLPEINTLDDVNEDFWNRRFEQIQNFEKHITENGTIVFKFFLHISKEEQRQRILRRIRKSKKNWKFSPNDLEERKLWREYRCAFQDAINKTSKEYASWYVIPANHKPTARYLVAKVLWEELQKYEDVKEPELDPEILKNLENYKEALEKE